MACTIQTRMIYNGNSWQPFGLIMRDNGERLDIGTWQEDLELIGMEVKTNNVLPSRSIVIAVNIRILAPVTGTPALAIGVPSEYGRYGNRIGTAKDTTNIGMSYHPITYYEDTPIVVTGGRFSSGIIRISTQYFQPHGPWHW